MTSAEVDNYLEGCPPEHREALIVLRKLVHRVAPDVVESIQYKIPMFTLGAETLCSMSSRAAYLALYCDPAVVKRHASGLKGLDVGKSCIRFKKLAELDLKTVEAILREIRSALTAPSR